MTKAGLRVEAVQLTSGLNRRTRADDARTGLSKEKAEGEGRMKRKGGVISLWMHGGGLGKIPPKKVFSAVARGVREKEIEEEPASDGVCARGRQRLSKARHGITLLPVAHCAVTTVNSRHNEEVSR